MSLQDLKLGKWYTIEGGGGVLVQMEECDPRFMSLPKMVHKGSLF